MPVTIDWYDPTTQKVLIITIRQPFAWEDFDVAVDNTAALAGTIDHELVVVVYPEKNNINVTPTGGSALSHMRRMMKLLPPNVKYIAGINAQINPLMQMLLEVLARIGYAKRMIPIDTIDDAQKLLP
jgi:hypothetical protein